MIRFVIVGKLCTNLLTITAAFVRNELFIICSEFLNLELLSSSAKDSFTR